MPPATLMPRVPAALTAAPGALMDCSRNVPPVDRVTPPDGRPPAPSVDTAPPSVIEVPVITSTPPARAVPVPPSREICGAICTAPRDRITSVRPFVQPFGSPASAGFAGSGTQQLWIWARGPTYRESTVRVR